MKLKIFIFLLLLSGTSVFAQTRDDEALKSLVKKMTDAQAAFDAVALDKLLTSDYIEISPVGEFDSREKVLGFFKPELKPSAEQIPGLTEATDFSIRSYGKFAIVIARLNYVFTNDGKPLPPLNIRVTLVCRKERSMWKIASAQYTGIRSPQPAK